MRNTRIAHVAASLMTAGCAGQITLQAHDPPSTNNVLASCLLLFDLEAVDQPIVVSGMTVSVGAVPGQSFHFDVLVRDGTSLGGSATSGPGSSIDGWTSLGEVQGTAGPVYTGPSLPVTLPRFVLQPGHITGIALYAHYDWGFWFYWDSPNPYHVYSDAHLLLTTGDARDANPFGVGQHYFAKCVLVGSIIYELDPCYPNCDGSTIAPVLNVNDFICFLGKFANGDTYANCDGSTTPPVLNVNDFICFTTSFAQGCS